jgi:hypothetical protein
MTIDDGTMCRVETPPLDPVREDHRWAIAPAPTAFSSRVLLVGPHTFGLGVVCRNRASHVDFDDRSTVSTIL